MRPSIARRGPPRRVGENICKNAGRIEPPGYDERMRVRAFSAAAALTLAASLTLASAAAQPPRFRSAVELVDVAVVVRDREGKFVQGLTRADFELIDGGIPQAISAFDRA